MTTTIEESLECLQGSDANLHPKLQVQDVPRSKQFEALPSRARQVSFAHHSYLPAIARSGKQCQCSPAE